VSHQETKFYVEATVTAPTHTVLWCVDSQRGLNGAGSSWSTFAFCVFFLTDELVIITWKQNAVTDISTEEGSDNKEIEKFT
jgi:hypothetical protein